MQISNKSPLAILGVVAMLCGTVLRPAPAQDSRSVTAAMVDRWMTELSNWGRWGKQDQMGAVNLITPAKRKQAASLVRDGVSVSLARNTETEKAADNDSPFVHTMTSTGKNPLEGFYSMDLIQVSYHGWAHTHMDSLCHMFYKGKMYNGYSQEDVSSQGAARLAVTNFKNGILSRGILMDIPRLKGVPYLEPGLAIYPEDLDAWEKKAGVKVGSDGASDVMPSGVAGVNQPIHQLVLIAMGMPIFDNLDLEAVSAEANKRKRWEFHLSAAPLAVTGGTGSPFNPIATF